jgi:hypothetical protein
MATLADMLRQVSWDNPNNPYSSNLLADALRGSLSNAESLGRGAAVAPLGIFGDVNALARKYVTPRLPAKVQAALESLPSAPTTEQILSNIPRASDVRRETSGLEQLGAAMNPTGPVEAAKGVAKGLGVYGRLAGNAINDAMVYGRGPLAEITPQPMHITAWHGSGKLFPEFDVTKTPEQGYAYTRGSYAAAAKREAEGKYMPRDSAYEEKLMGLYKNAEKKQDYDSMEVLEAAMLHQSPSDLRKNFIHSGDYDENFAKKASSLIDKIETFPKESYLYKLDVKDESLPSMLQYDNPISQQSPQIKEFAKELGLKETDLGGDLIGQLIAKNITGLDIQNVMKQKGIPGLIYNSPDVQGSVNYVTYDPELYKILEINDKPYEQWFPKGAYK